MEKDNADTPLKVMQFEMALPNRLNTDNQFDKIAKKLYNRDYTFDTIYELNFKDFIEAIRIDGRFKVEKFYEKLVRAMPKVKPRPYHAKIFDEVFNYCKQKIDEIKNEAAKKVEKQEPQTFDELFFEQYRKPDIIEACINVLREVEPQVINENNAYIGNYKQSFIIWLKELTGSVITKENPQTYSRLLNEKFHGLNMGKSGRSFGSETYASQKYSGYKSQIKNSISRDVKPLLK